MLAAACGDDSESSETTAAATETTGGSTETTGATETTGGSTETTGAPETTVDPLGTPNEASGDPIVVGVINEGGSDVGEEQSAKTLKGMQMAADYANEYLGGIGGHPIEIESCGNKNTPTGATDCANQMVEKQIDVYIHPYSGFESQIVTVLSPAGIPMFLAGSSSQEGLTSPGVFAMGGGYVATLGAFAVDALEQGVTKFAMIVTDVPAAANTSAALGGMTFGKMGVAFENVPVPLGTADFTPILQTAIANGADALGLTGDASFCVSFMQAYKALALTATKYIISTCLDQSVLEAVGDVIDGSRTVTSRGSADAVAADMAIFAAALLKYGGDFSDMDPEHSGGIMDGWVTMMGLVNALSGYTGEIDNASLTEAIKAATDVPIPMSGGLTFTCDGTAIPILANICSAALQIGVVDENGEFGELAPIDASVAFAT